MFEHPELISSLGQLYVALSRAQSLQGLQVLGFDAKKASPYIQITPQLTGTKVTANAAALKFMKDTFGSL